MKLESSPVGETRIDMIQIQSQLVNLTIQLQDIKKGKEVHEEVLCSQCWSEWHHKDQCPNFHEYLQDGAPNPLSHGGFPWCWICHTRGHQSEECVYLLKVVSKPMNIFCNFCRSVFHEEKECRVYDFLQERTTSNNLSRLGVWLVHEICESTNGASPENPNSNQD